jgi:hypothetical protein
LAIEKLIHLGSQKSKKHAGACLHEFIDLAALPHETGELIRLTTAPSFGLTVTGQF